MDAVHIEVRKIIRNQIFIESVRIDDIKTFRAWRKKEGDTFDGEATFLVLKPSEEKEEEGQPHEPGRPKKPLPTMLIQESYTNFLRRMSGKVINL